MVTFECETSEPFIKVKWLKNGAEIFSGDKYRMHSDRKVHFLSVLIIEMKDDAEYTCVIADDESVGTTARLHVEGNPHSFGLLWLFLARMEDKRPLCFVSRRCPGTHKTNGEH